MRSAKAARLVLAAVVLATGCAVGPNYARPDAPMTAEFKEANGWRTALPQDEALRTYWWQLYGDPALSDLESRVAPANQSLAAAEARFRQAQTLVLQARSNWLPTVVAGVSFARSRVSGTLGGGRGFGIGTTTNDFTIPGSISWELDLWGKIRRQVESSAASAQASAADLANTRLSLESELAVDYFQLRALDAQRRLLDETARSYERSLELEPQPA